MARPVSTNPASEIIRLRVTPEDKAELQRLAAVAGVSLSAYLLARGLAELDAE